MNSKNEKQKANAVGAICNRPNIEGKTQKGITLIALVITIIVLLILAGVTINMVLGDDGIIKQATDAGKAQTEAEEKQAIQIAIGEAKTSEYMGGMTEAEVEAKLGDLFDDDDETKPKYNNSIREIREFKDSEGNKQYLPIPKGMAYVYGTVDEGAVVLDSYGNEFVWVSVKSTAGWSEPGVEPSKDGVPDDSINTDFISMKTSVDTYKGFYVGRYETSYNGRRVASIGNVIPLYQTQVIDENVKTTWYTFYTKQKELYPKESNNSVVSGMIYGSQWDAIMDWMKNVPNNDPSITDDTKKYYTKNSTGMGWHLDNYEVGNPTHITGKDLDGGKNKVFNIYDLAGNYGEWAQDSYLSTRGWRGGSYGYQGSAYAASQELGTSPGVTSLTSFSSRLQLYIK